MKILLFGNPSTLHSNLAMGLRERGHEVRSISNRLGWRKFPVDDILLERNLYINQKLAFVKYVAEALPVLMKCRGYDIVQLSSPLLLDLRALHNIPALRFLRRFNRKVVLGAYGDDAYTVERMLNGKGLRYSDQRIGDTVREDEAARTQRRLWLDDTYGNMRLTRMAVEKCDAIVACLYEYWRCYEDICPEKLLHIPLPIVMEDTPKSFTVGERIKFFIGIQKERSMFKGTDIMLRAAKNVVERNSGKAELKVVENVPYEDYKRIMCGSDVILDQLYSYTPSMNSLLAMSKGIICIGGGEPESYDIVGEKTLKPIVNVEPTYESVCYAMEWIINNKGKIPLMKADSVEYVKRHHDYRDVARQYEELYKRLLEE